MRTQLRELLTRSTTSDEIVLTIRPWMLVGLETPWFEDAIVGIKAQSRANASALTCESNRSRSPYPVDRGSHSWIKSARIVDRRFTLIVDDHCDRTSGPGTLLHYAAALNVVLCTPAVLSARTGIVRRRL